MKMCIRDRYESVDGKPMPGYVDLMEELNHKFPLSEPQIVGEQNQKDFIALFGAILRMRNLLLSFDEFKGNELISERNLQDYLGRYQDLRDEWKRKQMCIRDSYQKIPGTGRRKDHLRCRCPQTGTYSVSFRGRGSHRAGSWIPVLRAV